MRCCGKEQMNLQLKVCRGAGAPRLRSTARCRGARRMRRPATARPASRAACPPFRPLRRCTPAPATATSTTPACATCRRAPPPAPSSFPSSVLFFHPTSVFVCPHVLPLRVGPEPGVSMQVTRPGRSKSPGSSKLAITTIFSAAAPTLPGLACNRSTEAVQASHARPGGKHVGVYFNKTARAQGMDPGPMGEDLNAGPARHYLQERVRHGYRPY